MLILKRDVCKKNPFWRSVSEKWVALLQTFSFGYLNCIAVKCAEPPQFKFYQEPDFSCVDDKTMHFRIVIVAPGTSIYSLFLYLKDLV